jgi:uncharacterized protein (TIGR00369 family)
MTGAGAPPAAAVPPGFAPVGTGGAFGRAIGPLYVKQDPGRAWLGFRVEPRHTNPMGICHGGMMASFCDMMLPVCAQHLDAALAQHVLPTVTLNMEYLAPTPLGAWVEGEGKVLRTTGTLAFLQGMVTANGKPVARASGVFRIGPAFKPPGG